MKGRRRWLKRGTGMAVGTEHMIAMPRMLRQVSLVRTKRLA